MDSAIWSFNLIHLIGPVTLRQHRNRLPWPTRIVVRVLVELLLFLRKRQEVAAFLETIWLHSVAKDAFMGIADRASPIAGIALLPDASCHKAATAHHLVQHHLEVVSLIVVHIDPDRAFIG